MQLPSAWRFFVLQFLLEFHRKIIDLCVLFDALTFRVSILCDCISVRIPTKNYQFLRAFLCYYLRRVDFFVLQLLLEFRRKIVDFGVHFHAIISGVLIFSSFYFCSNFDKKSSIWVCFLMRVNFFVPRTRELLFGPACQRGLHTRRYGR